MNYSKFALEGFTKSVRKELNPKWNIKLSILSPGGVKTKFADSMKFVSRHPAYTEDPEAPINGLLKYMRDPAMPATWADSDKCADVLINAILNQNDRPLPIRLNIGAGVLQLMRDDIHLYLDQMKEWEVEADMVMP
jgi:short-subunit dehydrogenase